MIYKVNVVENNIPPTTAIPIDTLLFAPEPKAKAIGKIPKIVHRDVMTIGLNLAAAATFTASNLDKPDSFF